MSRRKPPLTIDDHMHLSNLLKDLRCSVACLLRCTSMTSKLGRDAMAAVTVLDRLRDGLDDWLHRQAPPSRDPRRLAPNVYFGDQHFHARSADPAEMETDVFASWTPGY
jgi:hypothetical protein